MKSITSLFLIFALLSCNPADTEQRKNAKLVVLISIDQMKAEYLELFKPQLSEGFGKLMAEGKVYPNTHHYHAITTTAAGHATIATGHYPSNNGITDNTVYNRALGYKHYSIEDSTVTFIGIPNCQLNKVSAKRLLKPTLGDIVKTSNKKSKTYSVALKDRASILMGGKNANRAFWFDAESTQMVSTDYYTEDFPSWAEGYTAASVLAEDLEKGWILEDNFQPIANNTTGDTVEQEKGRFYPWFPHTVNSLDTVKVNDNKPGTFFWNTPYGDEYVLLFAKQIIEKQELGKDEHTDVLTIGLSAADVIGHHFGPHSYEVLDYYNKVDTYLADFISYLDNKIGKDNYVLTLTADHGVAALPEVLAARGIDAQRIQNEQFVNDMSKIEQDLKSVFNTTEDLILKANYGGVEPNFKAYGDSAQLVDSLCAKLKRLSYIEDTYTFRDMDDISCQKKYIQEYRNSHRNEFGYYIRYRVKENYLVDMREHGTTHGTPYAYDTHVPFILYGNVTSGTVDTRQKTVDIVPTLLDIIGLETDFTFDGVSALVR